MESSKLIKKYLTNFDYEYSLFDENYSHNDKKYQKMRAEFEYVFFFVEKEHSLLINENNYQPDYLSYLRELGLTIPDFSKVKNKYLNWWGDLSDYEVEKILNSKITSSKLSLSKGWEPKESKICYSRDSIIDHLLKHLDIKRWFFRNPYSMAGRGNFTVGIEDKNWRTYLEKKIQKDIPNGLILSPQLSRILDLGVRVFTGTLKKEITINLLNDNGQFNGGLIYSNEEEIKAYIKNKTLIECESIFEKWEEIANYYQNIKEIKSIQIDSFFYQEKSNIKIFPLVEVNYRKTMGDMLKSLKTFLPKDGVGAWVVFNRKELELIKNIDEFKKQYKDVLYRLDTKEGVILTSPVHNQFYSFFIAANNRSSLKEIYQSAFPGYTKHSF